jgi:hypothetical protein
MRQNFFNVSTTMRDFALSRSGQGFAQKQLRIFPMRGFTQSAEMPSAGGL